jgi:hypothetical protein
MRQKLKLRKRPQAFVQMIYLRSRNNNENFCARYNRFTQQATGIGHLVRRIEMERYFSHQALVRNK